MREKITPFHNSRKTVKYKGALSNNILQKDRVMLSGRKNTSDVTKIHDELNSSTRNQISKEFEKEKYIGEYLIKEKIGEGNFSIVYKVTRPNGNDPSKYFALKLLKSHNKKIEKLFYKEISLLKHLHHKSLPQYIQQGEFERNPYVVMEYIAGKMLCDVLQIKDRRKENNLLWGYQLAESIRHLHSFNVVHCDIKPSNIKISFSKNYDGSLRLLDLGTALLKTSIREEVIGSLKYMSPEQISGTQPEKPSDIYSMGLIIYELLTGRYPYDIENVVTAHDWKIVHLESDPAPFPKDIPEKIAKLILLCLAKSPENRPEIEQVYKIFAQNISGIGIPSPVGILGARGSGKTCYLVSLYHEAEVDDETRNILEDPYIALYQEGKLPEATALSSFRLNYHITTSKRFYNIVTRDYGGNSLREGEKNNQVKP